MLCGYWLRLQTSERLPHGQRDRANSDYVYASSRQKGASDVRVILRGEMTSISQNDEAISTCRFSATAPDLVSRAVNCSNWCSGLSVKEMANWWPYSLAQVLHSSVPELWGGPRLASETALKKLQVGCRLQSEGRVAVITALHWMECRRGLAMGILSVRLSNAWIVTKRKKDLSRFLYHTKDHLS